MTTDEIMFAALLLASGLLVTVGAALAHPSLGFACAGVLLASWSWLVLAGDEDDDEAVEGETDL